MKKLTCYYAHFMGIYNTQQEKNDLELLTTLGFEIVNPNTLEISQAFLKLLIDKVDYMKAFDSIFNNCVRKSDIIAFRALPDGNISSGVALEIKEAQKHKKLIIELPDNISNRILSIEETKKRLRETKTK